MGYIIFVANTDSFGTIENNAQMLKEEIMNIASNNGGKVNIIAHSKGGLDAKYMIENLEMIPYVASFTTLCTPHRGSPIASAILKAPPFILKIIAFFLNTFYRICGDKKPDSLTVCGQLQRLEPNDNETNFIPGIYCQSFSVTMEKGAKKNDFIMRIPLAFSRYYEKNAKTDGLVPRDSTIFGEYKGDCMDGSVSHSEVIDFMVRNSKREKVYGFYSELCSGLSKAGF